MSPPLLQTYADAVSAQGAPLNNCFGFIDGTVRPIDLLMCVYGDRTYPLRAHLQAPFRAGARAITPAMELYNKNMSKVRTSVEWIFGDVINSFKSLDYKNNLKIGLSTLEKCMLFVQSFAML